MANADFVIQFALSVLAVYRVSYMISNEDGPLDMFSKLRDRVGQVNWIGRGLNCCLCVSFWISAIPAIFMPGIPVLNWLAIAGMTLIIHKRIHTR